MKRQFSPILLVGAESEAPAWLVRGAPAGTPLLCCPSSGQARGILERGEVKLLVCETCDSDGHNTAQLLEDVICDFPNVGTVGVVSRLRAEPDELLRTARSGVHALLFEEDQGTPLVVRRVLSEAATRCRNQSVWGYVEPMTPDRVRPMVAYGLNHAHQALTVDGVAHALGLHRKTLHERCYLAGTLPPQQMLGWCRLLAAAVLLEDRGRPVDHIAFELDFPSGAAFRNMLKRYTGLSPAELRAHGTIREMSRLFAKAVTPAAWKRSTSQAG